MSIQAAMEIPLFKDTAPCPSYGGEENSEAGSATQLETKPHIDRIRPGLLGKPNAQLSSDKYEIILALNPLDALYHSSCTKSYPGPPIPVASAEQDDADRYSEMAEAGDSDTSDADDIAISHSSSECGAAEQGPTEEEDAVTQLVNDSEDDDASYEEDKEIMCDSRVYGETRRQVSEDEARPTRELANVESKDKNEGPYWSAKDDLLTPEENRDCDPPYEEQERVIQWFALDGEGWDKVTSADQHFANQNSNDEEVEDQSADCLLEKGPNYDEQWEERVEDEEDYGDEEEYGDEEDYEDEEDAGSDKNGEDPSSHEDEEDPSSYDDQEEYLHESRDVEEMQTRVAEENVKIVQDGPNHQPNDKPAKGKQINEGVKVDIHCDRCEELDEGYDSF
ncbi:hypothetical protein FRC17_010452 [Serendipita sp. 399]|nr:hypothetical protein FRC17_010452 [Serendipita sp. 399]